MRYFYLVPLTAVIFALLAGCDNSPTGPTVRPATDLVIRESGTVLTTLTIQAGERVQLVAQPLDVNGDALSGREITWSSSDTTVATVSAEGILTGISGGDTEVRAETDGAARTLAVSVQEAPPLLPVACADDSDPIRLAMGETLTTNALDDQVVCLDTEPGELYLLAHFNASSVTGSTVQLQIDGAGISSVSGGPSELKISGRRAGEMASLEPASSFHRELRFREIRDLPSLVKPGGSPAPRISPSRSMMFDVPSVGSTIRLNVSSTSCSEPDWRTGRVEAVTERAVVVADVDNPRGGFSTTEYRRIGEQFDNDIWDISVQHFGEPSDMDENGRVVIFFTRAVNELTESGSNVLTQGFFFARDLFPRKATSEFGACATSNEAEILYLLAPDPDGVVNANPRSKQFVKDHTPGVLIHELQHLISASRRLRILGTENFLEEVWMNEGLSHIAEELLFYSLTGLRAGENLSGRAIEQAGEINEFRRSQEPNIRRLRSFLEAPNTESVMGDASLASRGSAWSFLRYAADRRAGDDATLLRALIDSDLTGLDNLSTQVGESILNWMQDWTVALAVDDIGLPLADRHQIHSWDLRSIYYELMNTNYPLLIAALGAEGQQLPLRRGGVAYTILRAGSSSTAIRTTAGGAPAPSSLRYSIVRAF